jgi:hypothetical protein
MLAVETIADHRRLTSDQVQQRPDALRKAGLVELDGSPCSLADGVAVVRTTAEHPSPNFPVRGQRLRGSLVRRFDNLMLLGGWGQCD